MMIYRLRIPVVGGFLTGSSMETCEASTSGEEVELSTLYYPRTVLLQYNILGAYVLKAIALQDTQADLSGKRLRHSEKAFR